jgi:hypothetical protein
MIPSGELAASHRPLGTEEEGQDREIGEQHATRSGGTDSGVLALFGSQPTDREPWLKASNGDDAHYIYRNLKERQGRTFPRITTTTVASRSTSRDFLSDVNRQAKRSPFGFLGQLADPRPQRKHTRKR